MASGNVSITVVDSNSAAVIVPGSNVTFVMGTCSSGTPLQFVASANPNTFVSNLGYGPLTELAGLLASNGGVVIACPLTINAAGVATGSTISPVTITSTTNASPTVVTATAHGFSNGDVITIAGVTTDTTANGTWTIYQATTNTFALYGSTAGGVGSGGTATPTGIVYTTVAGGAATGTSVPTATMAATTGCFDNYYVQINVITGGTIGTGPIALQFSLDAGRTFGPTYQLGTNTSYAIPNTGITIDFAAGTLVTGEIIRMATTAPAWSTAGVSAALSAFQSSAYAIQGVGQMYLTGAVTESQAASIQGYLNTLQTGYIYNRILLESVDVTTPTAWGGAGGQTEAAWMTSIEGSFAALSGNRCDVGAGYYNIGSVYVNPIAGSPIYRRPGQWAAGWRQVACPPQLYAAQVNLGSLSPIIVNPLTDPTDGFVYHDERINPGLDASRFTSFWTRVGLPGYYLRNANLMSVIGSTLTILPLGLVLDVACDIVHQVGQQQIDSSLRLNSNGTIYINDAQALQQAFISAINAQMSTMLSGPPVVSVDLTTNVRATGIVNISVTLNSLGYVLQENVTIGYNNSAG